MFNEFLWFAMLITTYSFLIIIAVFLKKWIIRLGCSSDYYSKHSSFKTNYNIWN